jgi:hypothetical protein
MWQKLVLGTLTLVLSAGASFAQDWRHYPPPRPYPNRSDYTQEYRRGEDWRDRREDSRHAFVYGDNGGGSFEDQGRGRWTEYTRNGEFHYREVRRGPRVIELYDRARNIGVRLGDDMSWWNSDTTGGWAPLYAGEWQ